SNVTNKKELLHSLFTNLKSHIKIMRLTSSIKLSSFKKTFSLFFESYLKKNKNAQAHTGTSTSTLIFSNLTTSYLFFTRLVDCNIPSSSLYLASVLLAM